MEKRNRTLIGIFVTVVVLILGMTYIFQPFAPKEPPKIRITFQGQESYYVVGKNEWNGSKYDRMDVLTQVSLSSVDRVYVPEGETVEIEFEGKAPKSYKLTKELLKEDSARTEVPIEFQNKKGSFIHSTLDMKNVDDKAMFVGYRLTCQWGKNSCEYGFEIRNAFDK